jgi:hypothetical protein
MATDGVDRAFSGMIPFGDHPATIVEAIVGTLARPSDDAMVLAARYVGEAR